MDEGREVDEAGRDPPAKPSERASVGTLMTSQESGAKTQCILLDYSSMGLSHTDGFSPVRDCLTILYQGPRKLGDTHPGYCSLRNPVSAPTFGKTKK